MIGIWFPITKGEFALVDRDVFDLVKDIKWHCIVNRSGNKYASRTIYVSPIESHAESLHQFVMFLGIKEYIEDIDHRNNDSLDCRRENLRLATRAQNNANRKKINIGHSKYKGVSTYCYVGGWRAYIKSRGKYKHLGVFDAEEEAARAYDLAAIKYFGEFAYTNFPREEYKDEKLLFMS